MPRHNLSTLFHYIRAMVPGITPNGRSNRANCVGVIERPRRNSRQDRPSSFDRHAQRCAEDRRFTSRPATFRLFATSNTSRRSCNSNSPVSCVSMALDNTTAAADVNRDQPESRQAAIANSGIQFSIARSFSISSGIDGSVCATRSRLSSVHRRSFACQHFEFGHPAQFVFAD